MHREGGAKNEGQDDVAQPPQQEQEDRKRGAPVFQLIFDGQGHGASWLGR